MIYLVERAKYLGTYMDKQLVSSHWELVGYTEDCAKANKYLNPDYVYVDKDFKYRYRIVSKLT